VVSDLPTWLTMQRDELPTPALCLDLDALDHNIDTMAAARPDTTLRPHVKAFKSTELARHVRDRGGHRSFCCATLREMEGMVDAGLSDDLLLANQTLDAARLGALAARSPHPITVAVDSTETLAVALEASERGPVAVLIDVNVGMPRCGCDPETAAALAARARSAGLEVRGVMGYEGHVVGNPDRGWRREQVARSMAVLREAHALVGGEVISAGGTGTYDLHDWVSEVQAGSYLLMDTAYGELGLPFRQALSVAATVLSVNDEHYAVADAGLKAFGMDHGDPTMVDHDVFFCSDEHVTFTWIDGRRPVVGDRVTLYPAHVDPTVTCHERVWVLRGDEVIEAWPIDLRNW
jgi:D-serine deaminase-like pyridoxal phosphate-dependent protein